MRKPRVMMAAVASLVLGCAGGGPALGNEQCSEIVYGDGHGSVVITAPEGWVFDHESGRDPGLHALLYPVGTTRTKAPTILYVKTVSKERHPTVQGLISSDVERQKAASPALRIAAGDPVPTARGSKAPVNHLSGGKGGQLRVGRVPRSSCGLCDDRSVV